MSLAARKKARPVPTMNVTPLVDVVLVLLIIFMVVVPMMDKIPAVTLPDFMNPDTAAKSKTDPYTLAVAFDGSLWLEDQKLAEAELDAKLHDANEKDPKRRLVVRVDRNTEYGNVRKLFKVCQGVGFPGVSLRVNALTKQ